MSLWKAEMVVRPVCNPQIASFSTELLFSFFACDSILITSDFYTCLHLLQIKQTELVYNFWNDIYSFTLFPELKPPETSALQQLAAERPIHKFSEFNSNRVAS